MIRKRVASIDDTVIYRLVVEEIAPFSKKFKNSSAVPLSSIRKRLLRNTTFVTAKGNRHPFGFISVFRKNRILFVDMLAVDPKAQGRGWGKQLMRAAEQFGKSKGCNAVQLFVDDSNPKAIGFYQALGYMTGPYIAEVGCYLMDKVLPPS
jgi:ribosomal protein S18 acetylase RimI-like enzyme